MDEHDWLAERFEADRTHLRAVAYRMLGSLSEADDAVQEAWLRLSRSGANGVENLGGWLTTVVARVCLDMLRSRTSRREDPFGEHDARIAREPRRRDRPRARSAARRLGRSRAAGGPRHVGSGRAGRVRVARHVRRALRRDRSHPRANAGRGTAAREPRTPPGAGGDRARRRSHPSASDRGRLPRRRPRRRLRRAPRAARPGCRGPSRPRCRACRRDGRGPRGAGRRRDLLRARPGRATGARGRRRRTRVDAARTAAAWSSTSRSPTERSSGSI